MNLSELQNRANRLKKTETQTYQGVAASTEISAADWYAANIGEFDCD
jgi:hypothetical protein